MIQTNFREIDMEDMDAKAFADSLKSLHANAVMLNTGGIIASYPTKVKEHFQSEYLHGDSLRQMIDACHEAGIRVIARMDFSKIRRPIYEEHPEWAYRTKDGEIVDYNGDVHACICGGYQQEKIFEIIDEVVSELPIDGFFMNMGGFQTKDYSYNYYGICHCESCKKKFRERFGLELPEKEDPDDPLYRKYQIFKQEVQEEFKARVEKAIHTINPEIAIEGIDYSRVESNTEYKRPLPFWQYSAASNTRTMRGIDNTAPFASASVDFIGFAYRVVAVNPEEQELRLWQDVANFGGVDYYLIGRLDNHEDKSGFENVERVFRYSEEHADEYRNISSTADVLLVRGYRWDVEQEQRGWIRALAESHILFDEVEESHIKPEDNISKYKAIVLPDITEIPDWLAEKLDRYAENGGCVIASGNTGKYHTDYPLKCMGIQKIKYLRQDMKSAMLHVEESDLDVFESFEKDRVLYFGDNFLFAEFESSSKGLLKLIPPHHMGPPERCYYTQITDIPGVQVNQYGKGTGVLIPWTPGLLYYRDGYANTFRFMRDLLKNIAQIESVEAAPFSQMIEISMGTAREGRHSLVQVVNNTGHFGTSYFKPVPVYGISLKIPCPQKPEKVSSQTTGLEIPYQWENGKLLLTVDCPEYFEGIKIQY